MNPPVTPGEILPDLGKDSINFLYTSSIICIKYLKFYTFTENHDPPVAN